MKALRPGVALPRDGLPLPVMLGAVFALGLGLFLSLEGHRQAGQARPMAMVATPEIPPLTVPEPVAARPVIAMTVPVARMEPLPHPMPRP
jgi:type IV secretion system protein VirB10